MRSVENLRGPAGPLEALLNHGLRPEAETAPLSVLLCHPHPLFGGTIHNKVVYHTMKSLTGLGLPVLRFNFRGVGLSAGQHDGGHGEQDDARTGLEWLHAEFGLPILSVGFSFGASMALRAGNADSRVAGLVSLGTPVRAADRQYSYKFLLDCTKPRLFLSGTEDEFGPVAEVEAALAPLPEPKQVSWVTGADHFFTGHLPAMQAILSAWVRQRFLEGR